MNLLLIGHSVADIVVTSGNNDIKPGGIAYSVAGLKSFLDGEDKVFLCTAVDEKYEQVFSSLYKNFSEIPIQKINSMPVVELTVPETDEREEKYSNIPEQLSLPDVKFEKIDGIYINMVSGFDISLEQLMYLRKNFKGLIYFDVHTFSRGVEADNKRVFRKIMDFHKWARCIDIIQANEMELKTLSTKTAELEIINELMGYGIKQVIITKGDKGSIVFFNDEGVINSTSLNAIKIKSINKIGCGDVFGALYFYKYISNKNISIALKFANTAAGITTTYSDINDYMKLNNDVQLRLNKD